MQGGHSNSGTANKNRLQHSKRRCLASPANRDLNVQQDGGAFLGWQLERNCPTGSLCSRSQSLLNCKIVNLDDHPVDLIGKFVAVLNPIGTKLVDPVKILNNLRLGIDRDPHVAEPGKGRRMRRGFFGSNNLAKLITPPGQSTRCSDARILLPQRSCSRVARVHRNRFLTVALSC